MVIKSLLLSGLLLPATFFSCAQKTDPIINASEAQRIEKVLASDEMKGRKVFTPDIDRAADFISSEFKAISLQPLDSSGTYLQEFTMVKPELIKVSAVIDGEDALPGDIVVVSCKTELKFDQSSGYEVIQLKPGGNIYKEGQAIVHSGKNLLVIVDTSYYGVFVRLNYLKRTIFKTDKTIVFLLAASTPKTYSVEFEQAINEQKLKNVVGVLPGKSKKNELVVFSGHYDHLGIGEPLKGDSIYNGANDDAAGTTAVILLARYFKSKANNERTLVFAAFTAEEVGGYGSQYFSRQFDPATVIAMFNIEMIGTESKWGKNSAYITGYEKSDMGKILQKDLKGTGFKFYPDPYTAENLFYRSDNATLARLGVPAHTISTSKMDNEPNYHKPSDQVETLDLNNMARIIRSIALSAKSIISGKATPGRVETESLQYNKY